MSHHSEYCLLYFLFCCLCTLYKHRMICDYLMRIIVLYFINCEMCIIALRGHRLGYRLGYLVSLIYGTGTCVPRGAPLCAHVSFFHVSFFHVSYYSLAMILVSASSSCFTVAVSIREVYCVRYEPRAWDPSSL